VIDVAGAGFVETEFDGVGAGGTERIINKPEVIAR